MDLSSITWRTNVGNVVYDLDTSNSEKIEDTSGDTKLYIEKDSENNKFTIIRIRKGGTDYSVNSWYSSVKDKYKSSTIKTSGYSLASAMVLEENGKKVTMYGNSDRPSKNAIWYNREENQAFRSISFEIDSLDFGDSFNSAGILLGTEKGNGQLEGYLISFNNSAAYKVTYGTTYNTNWYKYYGNKYGTLLKFSYDANNTKNFDISKTQELEKIEELDITEAKGTISIILNGNNMEIRKGSEVLANINNVSTIKSFGFFSDHFDHGCQYIGQFIIKNIQIKMIGGE